jgi:hypothetical protein
MSHYFDLLGAVIWYNPAHAKGTQKSINNGRTSRYFAD